MSEKSAEALFTETVTENAISVLKVIRASFRQSDINVTDKTMVSSTKVNTKAPDQLVGLPVQAQKSAASRGRGIKKLN